MYRVKQVGNYYYPQRRFLFVFWVKVAVMVNIYGRYVAKSRFQTFEGALSAVEEVEASKERIKLRRNNERLEKKRAKIYKVNIK